MVEKEPDKLENRGILLTMLIQEFGSPGIMVSEDIAGRTPCRCYKIDDTEMCFSKGIIGTMSKAQCEAYCPTKEYVESKKMTERVRKFKEAAKEAHEKIEHLPKGERLEPWLTSMGEELRKRGIEP